MEKITVGLLLMLALPLSARPLTLPLSIGPTALKPIRQGNSLERQCLNATRGHTLPFERFIVKNRGAWPLGSRDVPPKCQRAIVSFLLKHRGFKFKAYRHSPKDTRRLRRNILLNRSVSGDITEWQALTILMGAFE